MPVLDRPKAITCPKCDAKHNVSLMRRLNRLACMRCDEPLRELIDLDRCDWSEGDTPEQPAR